MEDNTFLYVGKDGNPYYYFFFCRINDVWYDEISIHYGTKVICRMICDDDNDLERVYFPADLERIEEYAFSNCSKLESIILKDGLKYLGKYAFAYCINVTQVELPSSLEEIDDFCFDSLEPVTSFRFHGTLAQWHSIKKGKGWIGGDCDFDIVCDDGVIPIKIKDRYCVHDRRNDSVKHFNVKDQIDEMVTFNRNNKIINCSYLYTSLDEYLSRYPKRFPKDKIITLLYGMIRLFVSTCGICTHEQYLLYLNIARKTEADISYEKYLKLMTDNSYSPKLEEAAFDIITCELPLVMRFYISIIGVALMSYNNKLPQSIYSLVDEIIGPIE